MCEEHSALRIEQGVEAEQHDCEMYGSLGDVSRSQLNAGLQTLVGSVNALQQTMSDGFHRLFDVMHDAHQSRASFAVADVPRGKLPNRVRLDVGGTVFTTSLSTLTRVKGTFFESMFGGRWPLTPEPDGTFFIDRDPKGFPLVLKCLRGERIDANTFSTGEMTAFIADVEYYALPYDMVEKCTGSKLGLAGELFSTVDYGEGVTLSDSNLEATIDADDGHSEHYVLGSNIYRCPDHVVITILIKRGSYALKLGVVGQCLNDDDNEDYYGAHEDIFSLFGFSQVTRWEAGVTDEHSHATSLSFSAGETVEVEVDCKQHKVTVRNTTHNISDSVKLPPTLHYQLAVSMPAKRDPNTNAIANVRIMGSKHVL